MRRAAVGVLCLVQFVDVLGVTSATTAVPSILAGAHAPPPAAGLIATTYAMFFGGLLVVGARLGDRFGHRRMLLVGLGGLVLVSVIGGLATSLVPVLAARALQGASAAMSVPAALRLLLHVAPEERARRGALALWSASGAVAGAAGFVVGGALVVAGGWPAVFWINAPVGVALIVATLAAVPDPAERRIRSPLDLPGGVLLIASVMLLVVAGALAEHGDEPPAGASLALGLGAGALFTVRMRRAAHPLIPRAAFRSRALRHGTALSFVNTATTSSAAVLATLRLQDVLRLSALLAGLTLAGFSVMVVVGSSLARPTLDRLGRYGTAALGTAVIALADLGLALTGSTWAGIAVSMAVAGLGIGLSSVAATSLGTDVPGDLAGSASGVLNTGAQLGTALGTAAVVTIAGVLGDPVGWGVAAVIALVASVWAFTTARRRHPD